MKLNQKTENLTSAMKKARVLLKTLAFYHRYEVKGIEQFPLDGPVILAVHHSLATYDGFMLGMTLFEKTGRLIKGLGDDLLFKLPFTKNWVKDLGIYPAGPQAAKDLLKQGEALGVAPGGMRESLRSKEQRFKVLWKKRKGFIRLAVEENVPIVLAACPKADLIFDVYKSKITAFAYKHFKIPLPVMRGVGPTLIPRPVKLVHYMSSPLFPPDESFGTVGERVELFHQQVLLKMDELLSKRDI